MSERRRGLRRAGAGIAILAVLGIVAAAAYLLLGPRGRLDARTLEQVLQPAIASATGGLYHIEVGRVEASLSSPDVVVHDVRIAPNRDAVLRLRERGQLAALRFALEVDRFEILGVDRAAVLSGRGLVADRIEVRGPAIRATLDPPDERDGDTGGGPAGADTAERVTAWIRESLEGVPELSVGTVAIRDGSATLVTGEGDSTVLRVGRVDVTFQGLHIHEDATPPEVRSLFSHDIRLEASDFDLGERDGPQWRLGTLGLSTGQGGAWLTDVRLDPAATVPEYLSRPHLREPDRRALWIGRLDAVGIDFSRLLGRLDLHMQRLAVRGFRVEILDDRHKPPRDDDGAPRMPHDLVRELDIGLAVDEVQLRDGYVSYSERHPEAPRPGTISFEGITGTVTNLGNHPALTTAQTPSVWRIEAAINGSALLRLTVAIPLLAPPPRMRVEGRIGPFDAAILNPILVPLMGRQIRGGAVQGISFDLDYSDTAAEGEFRAEYRDLALSPVDRTTGDRDLKDVVLGFVASTFLIRGDNVSGPEGPARTAPIHYPIDPREPFFKILWEPLRDGAIAIVKQ